MGGREELTRVFGMWLELSADREILTLLELVTEALRRRGYTVSPEVRPPEPKTL